MPTFRITIVSNGFVVTAYSDDDDFRKREEFVFHSKEEVLKFLTEREDFNHA